MSSRPHLALYAAVGPELVHYAVDAAAATLDRRGSITLPSNIHYAVPHAARHTLYLASSDSASGSGTFVGSIHHLSACRIDATSGALTPHGPRLDLPSRPIHVTTDAASRFILVAYNRPSLLQVYRLNADGTLGAEVRQDEPVDAGIFAHQIRLTPDDRLAILVTRGNDAAGGKPEDPGSLRVFRFEDGQLRGETAIAPGGGYGFGPRHLDFHPTHPWVYVALERQNRLEMFRRNGDALESAPAFAAPTLERPAELRPRQMVGTVRVHPNGRYVYVANRHDGTVDFGGRKVNGGGENSLACFAIDAASGAPQLVGHAATRGLHCRNFAFDPAGRLLAASHIAGGAVREGDGVREVPCCIALFRVGEDGRPAFARKLDIEPGGRHLFWMGLVDY